MKVEHNLSEHIGRSEEFMRATEKRFDTFDSDLLEIKKAVQMVPQLVQDINIMKPQVASWVAARKASLWMLGIVGTFSALFTDIVNKTLNRLF